jgi:hypothetical protein
VGGGNSNRGLWYFVEGTGTEITITTCSEYTNFDARISVILGDEYPSTLGCLGPGTILFPTYSDDCGSESSVS